MHIQSTYFFRLFICIIFWLRSFFSPIQRVFSVSPSVIITEVEYDATQGWTDTDYEWFELFNPTSGTVSLSGWTIQDNQFVYPFWSAISLPAGWYLLVANNTWFSVNYPSITPNSTIFPATRLPLANAWDYLLLKNELWTDIDQVIWNTYWSASAWTSLCRINSTDTDSPWDWMSNCVASPSSGGYSFALPDTTPPVVVLLGSGLVSIEQYSTWYVEVWASRSDAVDGTGTILVPTSWAIDTWNVGMYLLEYVYIDSSWNTGNVVTRTITVTDIDECVLATDNCDVNASCTNTVWSFTCACNAWFTGNGVICTPLVCDPWLYLSGSSCLSCAPGSFSALSGATSCTQCLPWTYQSNAEAISCDSCPSWMISMTWATSCQPCDSGTYASGNSCVSCGSGSVSSTWSTSCTECAAWTYASGNSCLTCDPWTFSSTWATSCTLCAPWTSQASSGASSCDACEAWRTATTWSTVCTPCNIWTYGSGNECISCGSGTFTDQTWMTSCSACPWWTYNTWMWATSCFACDPWSYSDTWATSCTLCAPWSYVLEEGATSCMACAVGTYQSNSGDHACLQCAPWTYQDGTWAIACTQCMPWTYQSNFQSTSCETCPSWMVSMTWATACTSCGEWTYASGNSCLFCDIGTYNNSTWASSCIQCEAWKFMASTGAFACTLCAPWTYSSTGAVACEQCPANTYQPFAWSLTCLACPSGWISSTWSMVCDFCPSGTYRVWASCIANPPSWWASSSIQANTAYTVSNTNENESPQTLPSQQNDDSSPVEDGLSFSEIQEESEGNVSQEWEDQELFDAYTWAKKYGITTQDSFEKARMYETLTRGELAKMITNFSRQVIGLDYMADPTCTASVFVDYTERDDELRSYVEQSCSLGLMGRRNDSVWTIEKFRAYDLVTRAEFATVMSRLLFGSRYNGDGSEKRYINHLNAMKEAWYINLIDNPLLQEIRWFAMIIMMRIDKAN